jgi:hypothetical protein
VVSLSSRRRRVTAVVASAVAAIAAAVVLVVALGSSDGPGPAPALRQCSDPAPRASASRRCSSMACSPSVPEVAVTDLVGPLRKDSAPTSGGPSGGSL